MALEDDRNRVIEVFTKARPRAVSAEVKYLQAGPKGADLGKIGHSAEQPLPLPESLDRRVAYLHRNYKRAISACARHADDIERIERELLTRLNPDDARAEASGEGQSCEHCGAVVDKLVKDRCRSCYEYRRRHDIDRPQALIDAEVYGERTPVRFRGTLDSKVESLYSEPGAQPGSLIGRQEQ